MSGASLVWSCAVWLFGDRDTRANSPDPRTFQDLSSRGSATSTSRGDVSRSADAAQDRLLLERLERSDDSALTELSVRYSQALHKFAYVIVHDADAAADVVQEVFLSLWIRRHTIVISGTVADYLFAATRNRALKVLRHERSQARIQHIVRDDYTIVPPRGTDPDAGIVTEEFAAALNAAIQSLSPRTREAFLLSKISEMSYAEIAAVLHVGETTVRSHLSRATQQILSYLAPFR